LFKSFTGLSVQQFDNIYKEIKSKYEKYEIKRLSFKRNRERVVGAWRHFKLIVEDRVIMVLVYYRLYITYTMTEFLFGLDQSNVCRDIQKIEGLIRQCLPIPHKLYKITKRLKTKEEVEQYFPGFLAFIDSTEQQIPRPKNNRKRKACYSGKKKRHTVKTQLMVNNRGFIIHKSAKKKGKRHDYDIFKENHPLTPKQVLNVFDLGYLGVEKDFQNSYRHYRIERREKKSCHKKKKNITKVTLEKE
jgi:hypothetical protein